MPLEMDLWKIGPDDDLVKLGKTRLDSEARLQTWIAHKPELLGQDLLIIGREVRTAHGGKIDILAVDAVSTVHVIELKRDETPREVVAQALDYASWVVTLESEDLNGDLPNPLEEGSLIRIHRALPHAASRDA